MPSVAQEGEKKKEIERHGTKRTSNDLGALKILVGV